MSISVLKFKKPLSLIDIFQSRLCSVHIMDIRRLVFFLFRQNIVIWSEICVGFESGEITSKTQSLRNLFVDSYFVVRNPIERFLVLYNNQLLTYDQINPILQTAIYGKCSFGEARVFYLLPGRMSLALQVWILFFAAGPSTDKFKFIIIFISQ